MHLVGFIIRTETESETRATQDQELQTKYQATKLLPAATDRKCRFCPKNDEKVDIMSARTILLQEQYIKRHGRV